MALPYHVAEKLRGKKISEKSTASGEGSRGNCKLEEAAAEKDTEKIPEKQGIRVVKKTGFENQLF